MSAYSERVRKALYAKLNVAGVLSSGTGLATAVYNAKAPEGATLPFLIFQEQAASPVEYNFGQGIADETSFWAVQGFADKNSSATKSPQEVAETIAQNALTALGTTMTLTGGGTVTWLGRVNDITPLESQQGDRYVYQRGFLLRVSVE
jgi:hypothetical protein